MRILIPSTVEKVEEKREVIGAYTDPDTKEIFTQHRDLGWFILLSGSKEWQPAGMEKPDCSVGDKVTITIERTP